MPTTILSYNIPRKVSSVTIASGASTSTTIDQEKTLLVGVVMPAAWTTAALTIEASNDNSTWFTPNNSAGSEMSIASPSASAGYAVDFVGLSAWRYLRFRSGTASSAVNQGADRVLVTVTRPMA